jgi:hypothetical protein
VTTPQRRKGRGLVGDVANVVLLNALVGAALPLAASAQTTSRTARVSADQLFQLAEAAERSGDVTTAERAYRALTDDPDIEKRTEARFRLALLLADRLGRVRDGATLLRRILDDRPNAARVRLELARLHARLGNRSAAERELRAAQAAGLPPEVERLVRFYAQALSADKPFGGSLEVALAPDNNINRATRSTTLGTVLGDFALDKEAKARSGLGVMLRGQIYGRIGIGPRSNLLVRASASGSLYRQSGFNDILLGLQAGPELGIGSSRVALSAGPGWRWYGQKPYTRSLGGTVDWRRPIGKRAQLTVDAAFASITNRRNAMESGRSWSLALAIDRALSARLGGGTQIHGVRLAARDPGYSSVSAGASAYLFREMGRTTIVATLAYSRLESDRRLAIFPKRRSEDRLGASVSASFRALSIRGFAPFVRLNWERNRSTIEIYDFRRIAAEFGLASAF